MEAILSAGSLGAGPLLGQTAATGQPEWNVTIFNKDHEVKEKACRGRAVPGGRTIRGESRKHLRIEATGLQASQTLRNYTNFRQPWQEGFHSPGEAFTVSVFLLKGINIKDVLDVLLIIFIM